MWWMYYFDGKQHCGFTGTKEELMKINPNGIFIQPQEYTINKNGTFTRNNFTC